MNTSKFITGGTVTRNLVGVARGGGFDRGVPDSAQNWLLFQTTFTLSAQNWLLFHTIFTLSAQNWLLFHTTFTLSAQNWLLFHTTFTL